MVPHMRADRGAVTDLGERTVGSDYPILVRSSAGSPAPLWAEKLGRGGVCLLPAVLVFGKV